jgi:uncharacterized protein with NRDE domain
MCLLAVLFRAHPDAPLVVAANRDEFLDRPSLPLQVLGDGEPRILGGKDESAGGTWLATNERGVVAALTNSPTPGGRDPHKRSRGELPLVVAREKSARAGVMALMSTLRPADFNPCWLLAGDREELFYVDWRASAARQPVVLKPGVHVLENRPYGAASGKVSWVQAALAQTHLWHGPQLVGGLGQMLSSHVLPEPAAGEQDFGFVRPPRTAAACVHAGPYGTRSATIVIVPADRSARPEVFFADGPPHATAFKSFSNLWRL